MNFVRRLRAAALVLPVLAGAGCQSLFQDANDTLVCARDYSDSWHAWKYYRTACPDEYWYPHHYGKGFRAGYRNVASGGDGCPPTLPPSCYWSVCYQNAAGQQKVQEWFRGFVFGANAARVDGVADYNQILTSERLFGRCGPQTSPADVHYFDHGSGWSSDGNHMTPTPTPAPNTPVTPPSAPGAEIPAEPYFPGDAPAPPSEELNESAPRAQAPNRAFLELLQAPDGPVLQ